MIKVPTRSGVLTRVLLCLAFVLDGADSGAQQGVSETPAAGVSRKHGPWSPRRRMGVVVASDQTESLPDTPIGRAVTADGSSRGLSRRALRELGLRPRGRGLINIAQWPPEPKPPPKLDAERFGRALTQLCPPTVPAEKVAVYARWIINYASQFDVDPALLAALTYQQSRCRAHKRNSWGLGLTMINLGMHQAHVQQGRYRFGVPQGRSWHRQYLDIGAFPFTPEALLQPKSNLYFAAAILSVFKRQWPALGRAFNSVPHRHYVSHFIWGDRVRSSAVEDLILRARRRLLTYYDDRPPVALARFHAIPLYCPLDGAPRKVTSIVGDDRDGGRRHHTGIDFDSYRGEPVRAVADGIVELAGVDLGPRGIRPLKRHLVRLVHKAEMGPRGLLVTIRHGGGLTSDYMHLVAYVVETGQRVKGGQLIAYVGRTGIKESDAHLHLGFRLDGEPLDPMPLLRPYVLGPRATYVGQRYLAYQSEQRRLRRHCKHPSGKKETTSARRRLRRLRRPQDWAWTGGPAGE